MIHFVIIYTKQTASSDDYYETIFRIGISYLMSHLDFSDILCDEMYWYQFVGSIRINCMRPAILTVELAEQSGLFSMNVHRK